MTPDWYTPSAKPTNPGSWNRYAYAGDDPANNNDPSGLDVTCSFVDGQFICVDNVWGEVPNQTWWPTPTGIPIPDLGTLLTTAQNLSNARAADLANLTDAAKQLSKQAASGKMTDCEALAEFASAAAVKDGNSSWAFENDFQVLTPNSAAVMAVPGVSGQNGVVYLGNNGYPSGFQQQYQDSISPGQDEIAR